MEGGTVMATIIASVSEVFTASIGWVGTVAETISGEPILLLFTIIPVVGLGIGLFQRLLGR